jgi:hypothetical protein
MKIKIVMTILALLLIAAGAGGTYYYYTKYQAAQSSLENPELLAKTEVKTLTDKLGKLIALPSDEEPNVATVLDQEKLKDQPFFVNAKNGDKIVIYSQKKVAILYRESENIIIEVAPLTMESPEPEASTTPTKAKAVETPEPTEE